MSFVAFDKEESNFALNDVESESEEYTNNEEKGSDSYGARRKMRSWIKHLMYL